MSIYYIYINIYKYIELILIIEESMFFYCNAATCNSLRAIRPKKVPSRLSFPNVFFFVSFLKIYLETPRNICTFALSEEKIGEPAIKDKNCEH